MTISVHQNDLPADLDLGRVVAVDTETLGLRPHRDRLCVVQLSSGDGTAHVVTFDGTDYSAPNLRALLADEGVLKLFHFGRFDIAILAHALGVTAAPAYCTKIASRLVRTYTDHHSLKTLCRELLGVELDKQQQQTDWAALPLTPEQIRYAASDVLHLHALREKLDALLLRDGRKALADAAFAFLPHRALLDLGGFEDVDIFSHA